MNAKTIFTKRTSVRDFTDKKFTEEEIQELIEVINNSPTSFNSQQYSAILIRDQETKDYICKMNWNQKHIADSAMFILFVADRTRILSILDKELNDDIKNFEFMRSITDSAIAATFTQDYLISKGWGVTMVGGVLTFADKLEEKLNIPKDNIIVVGLSVGWPNSTHAVKTKMNKVFFEKYSKKNSIKEIKDYDKKTMDEFAPRHNGLGHIENLKYIYKNLENASVHNDNYIDNKYKKFK
ncbi:MAG: nitroreductase family protein [Mollicutes bacterium PWAP]|nr:nitroreductase family protein [Mollicutes bacterium PWAP]